MCPLGNQYQQELIDSILEGKNVIVKSARQMGTSTTMLYCIRELCLRNPGKKIIVHCVHNDYAKSFCQKLALNDEGIKVKNKFSIEMKFKFIFVYNSARKLPVRLPC